MNGACRGSIIASDATAAGFAPVDLYQRREKIFTRAIEGRFQRIRLYSGWPLLIGYFGLPWLDWGGRQAVLFDLPTRHFYVFGLTFWPQDFMLLAWLLIIAAFGLFTVTSVVGRLWCGYTCPQTVWTAIFMWVEQITEGPRHARIRLDRAPLSLEKVVRRGAKHAMWLGFAFATGLTFVGYFTPIRALTVGRRDAERRHHGGGLGVVLHDRNVRERRAGCGSRCASTCARTRAFSRRCSTTIR